MAYQCPGKDAETGLMAVFLSKGETYDAFIITIDE
jgi:hypothetical protein